MYTITSSWKRVFNAIFDSTRDHHVDQTRSQLTTVTMSARDVNHGQGAKQSPARPASRSTSVGNSGVNDNTRQDFRALSPSETQLASQAPVSLRMSTLDVGDTNMSPGPLRMSHKRRSNMLLSHISRSSTKPQDMTRGEVRDTSAPPTSSPTKNSAFSSPAAPATPKRSDFMETETVRRKDIGLTPHIPFRTSTPNDSSPAARMAEDVPTIPNNQRVTGTHKEPGPGLPFGKGNQATGVESQQIGNVMSPVAKDNDVEDLGSPQKSSPAPFAAKDTNAKIIKTPQGRGPETPIEEANEVTVLGDSQRRRSARSVFGTSDHATSPGAVESSGAESDVNRRNDAITFRTPQNQKIASPVVLESNRAESEAADERTNAAAPGTPRRHKSASPVTLEKDGVDRNNDAAAPTTAQRQKSASPVALETDVTEPNVDRSYGAAGLQTPQRHQSPSPVTQERNAIVSDVDRRNDTMAPGAPQTQNFASPAVQKNDATDRQASEKDGFDTGQVNTTAHESSSRRQRSRSPDPGGIDTNRSSPAQSVPTSVTREPKQNPCTISDRGSLRGMTSIRHKDIQILKDQRKLLEDGWIPAEPGKPTPQGHAPLDLIQWWIEQKQLSESTPKPQPPFADSGLPTVTSPGTRSEDDSDSESSAYTWSPSPVPDREPPPLPLDSSPLQRAEKTPNARSVASPQRDMGHGGRNANDPPMSSINVTPSHPRSADQAELYPAQMEMSSPTPITKEKAVSSQGIRDQGMQDDSRNESGMDASIPLPFDQPAQGDMADEVNMVNNDAVSSQNIRGQAMQDDSDNVSLMETSIPLPFDQHDDDDVNDVDELEAERPHVPQSTDKVQIVDTPWRESARHAQDHGNQSFPSRGLPMHQGSSGTAKTSSQSVIMNSYDSNGNPTVPKKPHIHKTHHSPVRASDGTDDDNDDAHDASIPSHQHSPLSRDIVPDSLCPSTQISSPEFSPFPQLHRSQAAVSNEPRASSPVVMDEVPAVSQKRQSEQLETDQPATKRQRTLDAHDMETEAPPGREAEDREEGSESVDESVDKPHQVYNKFKRDYPSYKGDFTHFARMCYKLHTLRQHGFMLKSFLWDDFIVQHLLQYKGYVESCVHAVEKPKPYESYFCDNFTRPECRKRSLNVPAIELLASQCEAPVTVDIPGAGLGGANPSFTASLAGEVGPSKVSPSRRGDRADKQAQKPRIATSMEESRDGDYETDSSEPASHVSSSVSQDEGGGEAGVRESPVLPKPPSTTASQTAEYGWQLTLEESREANLSALTEILQMPLPGPVEPGWAADPDTPFKVWARRHENLLSEKRRRGWTQLKVGRNGVIQPEQYIPLDWGYNSGWRWPSVREEQTGDRRPA